MNAYEILYGNRKKIALTGELLLLGHQYSTIFDESYQSYLDEIPVELRYSLKPVNYLQDMLLQMCSRSNEMLELCIYHQTQAVILADYLNTTGDRNRYRHDSPRDILQGAIGSTLSTDQLNFIDKCQLFITRGIYYSQNIVGSRLVSIKQQVKSLKVVEGFQSWQAIPLVCIDLLDTLPELPSWAWFREHLHETAKKICREREPDCHTPASLEYHQAMLLLGGVLNDALLLIRLFFKSSNIKDKLYACASESDIIQFENMMIAKARKSILIIEEAKVLRRIYISQAGGVPEVLRRILD
ncbi:MAG: hypothetical protein JAY94_04340 [Candidatus Thiodiazotropha endolucinida]|nr:hypothetical protein [Candidatus Thiodiazotropha taylori]MCW4316720.1 hypothetical protein [Candidatus Thiodiazotropha taylori]